MAAMKIAGFERYVLDSCFELIAEDIARDLSNVRSFGRTISCR